MRFHKLTIYWFFGTSYPRGTGSELAFFKDGTPVLDAFDEFLKYITSLARSIAGCRRPRIA